MNLSRRLLTIYKSQVSALKDRLDRIDAEEDLRVASARFESEARDELNGALRGDPPRGLRSPEDIASGAGPSARASIPPRNEEQNRGNEPLTAQPVSALARHYRVLGLDDGADLSAVKAAYARQAARCEPERFPEGSEEQRMAAEIRKRVDTAYDALRDALDPTAGRFDKLEL